MSRWNKTVLETVPILILTTDQKCQVGNMITVTERMFVLCLTQQTGQTVVDVFRLFLPE